jgi:hypothetical protein
MISADIMYHKMDRYINDAHKQYDTNMSKVLCKCRKCAQLPEGSKRVCERTTRTHSNTFGVDISTVSDADVLGPDESAIVCEGNESSDSHSNYPSVSELLKDTTDLRN